MTAYYLGSCAGLDDFLEGPRGDEDDKAERQRRHRAGNGVVQTALHHNQVAAVELLWLLQRKNANIRDAYQSYE